MPTTSASRVFSIVKGYSSSPVPSGLGCIGTEFEVDDVPLHAQLVMSDGRWLRESQHSAFHGIANHGSRMGT